MTGVDSGFESRSFDPSRTMPRNAPSEFDEKTCW